MLLLRISLLLAVLVFGAASSGHADSMPERSAAVLEFTISGNEEGGEDWAAGLADFTAAALQEHGVATFERSRLNYLLAEHKLQDQGFTQSIWAIRQKLPWVHFLVNGTVNKDKSAVFTLTLVLTDMSTGQEAARASKTGRYPDQIAEAASALAAQIAEKIAPAKGRKINRAEKQGFTNSPEVALCYYKGLDYYLRGQPEYAEHYFRQASNLDKNFFIAKSWRLRAYERLGLQDFADLVAKELHQAGGASAETQLKDKERLTVSVIPPADAESRNAALEEVLRAVITNHPSLQLFSHDTIAAVSDEIDLSLSSSFDQHMLKDQEWLATDALFSISRTEDEKHVTVQLIDSLSGQIVGTEQRAVGADKLEDIVQDMVMQLWKNNVTGSRQGLKMKYSLAPMTPKRIQNEWTQVEQEAYGLRLMSDNQSDKAALDFYLNVMLMGNMPNKGYEWPFIELVLNRLEALIKADEPDAPFWVYFIQWKRIFSRWFNPWATNETGMVMPRKDGKLLEQYFEPLIASNGDSLPGLLAQYAVALDKLYSGDQNAAFSSFDKISDKIAERRELALMQSLVQNDLPKGWRQYEVPAVVYYFAAKTALAIGRKDKAQDYAAKAKRILERLDVAAGKPVRIFPSVYGVQHFEKEWQLTNELLPPDFNIREGFRDEIDSINVSIASGSAKELSIDQLEDRLSAQDLNEEEKVAIGLRMLRLMTEDVKKNDKIRRYEILTRNVARRVLSTVQSDRKQEAVNTVKKLAAAYKKHYDQMLNTCPDIIGRCASYPISSTSFDELMFDLFALSGSDKLLEEQARQMMQSKLSKRRMMGVRNQAWLLYETKSPRESADFLLQEIQRFEKDFPQERKDDYVELLFWCGQTYLDAADEHHALAVYKQGVEQTVSLRKKDAHCDEKEFAAALMYEQAELLIKQNDLLAAADLLKNIVNLAEGCEHFSSKQVTERKKPNNGGYRATPFLSVRNGLREMALNKLESLRAAGKSANN